MKERPFAVPTGQLIEREMEASGVSWEELGTAIGVEFADAERVTTGQVIVTPEIAEKLVPLIGGTKDMWLRLEASFRKGVERGKPLLSEEALKAASSRGKLILRMPAALHHRVAERAKEKQVSLNKLLVAFVEEGMGESAAKVDPSNLNRTVLLQIPDRDPVQLEMPEIPRIGENLRFPGSATIYRVQAVTYEKRRRGWTPVVFAGILE